MRSAWKLLRFTLALGQWFLLAVSLYQTSITLLGQRRRERSPRIATPRFGVVVCARNEAAVIAGIISDLQRQTYPADLTEVVVVAHNCTDETASVARSAGARVVEHQTDQTGKRLAVLAGIANLQTPCDFVGVLDADSRVPETFLETVACLTPEAECLQVETVPQSHGAWLADGYGLGRKARNVFWWRPREELGLGTTVTGSGFFMRYALLQRVLSRSKTLTEDLEVTALLAAEGVRVSYVGETYVQVEEPHQFSQSMKQRTRWARGHIGVVWHTWPAVARQGLRGDLGAVDTAIFLLVPTRMLTRTSVTASLLLRAFGARFAPPMPLVTLAMAGEWLVPAALVVKTRLVPLSTGGLRLAFRHALLSLLWFPLGIWALLTAAEKRWEHSTRLGSRESDAIKTR